MNWRRLLSLGCAIFISLLCLSLILQLSGYSPVEVMKTLISSTWGSETGRLLVWSKTSLLILTGLAVALPYRAGLFNIGGAGQIYVGGLAAALLGTMSLEMGKFQLVACLGAGMACGALWAGIAAFLKTIRGVHEVISTIMLNFIAFQLVNELTLSVFNDGPGSSRTPMIVDAARMPILMTAGAAEVSWGILFSLSIAAGLSWFLYSTWQGFLLRACGSNPTAVIYAGKSVGKIQVSAMLLGGGCAGLAGAFQSTGVDHTFYARFGGGVGFDGIAVAFLAMCEPWAAIPAALAIATLRAADRSLQLDLGLPKEIVFILEGILLITIAIFSRWRTNHELR